MESVSLRLKAMIEDVDKGEHFIAQTYIRAIKAKKKKSRIEEITVMLEKMSGRQVENSHRYAVDEFNEPNHEVETLDVIMKLSRRV